MGENAIRPVHSARSVVFPSDHLSRKKDSEDLEEEEM